MDWIIRFLVFIVVLLISIEHRLYKIAVLLEKEFNRKEKNKELNNLIDSIESQFKK